MKKYKLSLYRTIPKKIKWYEWLMPWRSPYDVEKIGEIEYYKVRKKK